MVRRNFLRAIRVILAASAVAAATGATRAAEPSAPPPASATDARLRAALTERRNLLRESFEQVRRRQEAGQADADERHRAEIAFLLAEIDLAATPAERVSLREAVVKLAGERERLARTHFGAGRIRREAMTEATLGRVEAQVALGREKAALAARSTSATGSVTGVTKG